jgi:hypothetical protein
VEEDEDDGEENTQHLYALNPEPWSTQSTYAQNLEP